VSPLATVIVAWAAVYGYVCAYFCGLWGQSRRADDREYLAFGLLAGALAIYSLGAALMASADSLTEGAFALRMKLAGLAPGVAFTIDLCHQLVGRRRSPVLTTVYVWAGLGLALAVAGLLVDPSVPTAAPTWGLAAAPDYPEAALTPLGSVVVIVDWALVGYGLVMLVPASREDRDVRLVLLSILANVVAGGHDIFVQVASLRSVYLLEHAAMLSIVAMSYLLLDRFVRTSAELSSRRRELRHSYDELRHTQEELVHKEQLAAVGELSAVIAHEVRNPLAIIKNSASGLRKARLDAEGRSTLLQILDEEVERLNRLIEDLLAYARPLAPQARKIDLQQLAERSIETARAGNPKGEQVEIDVRRAESVPRVQGDPDLLRHALVNLVDNALKAMPAGGKLEVRFREVEIDADPAVAIDFRDTGEGMDTNIRSRARDPFFTTRASGTGLGLAIVERVVRSHGGRVEIESRHGAGTTVSVLLPLQRTISVPPLAEPARTET